MEVNEVYALKSVRADSTVNPVPPRTASSPRSGTLSAGIPLKPHGTPGQQQKV
jgi:hypothetical protein